MSLEFRKDIRDEDWRASEILTHLKPKDRIKSPIVRGENSSGVSPKGKKVGLQ